MEDNKARRLVSIAETGDVFGKLGRSTVDQLVKEGHLVKVFVGRRAMITSKSIDAYLDQLTEGAK